MSNYEVSVVAIAHNQEAFIERAIKSLITQDFALPYEIIVVNDSSTDNTENIIQSLVNKHDNIRLLNVSFKAPGLTRIAGLQAATGKYITFLDGDDFYHRSMIRILYDAMIKNAADLVHCSHFYLRKKHIQSNKLHRNAVFDKYGALNAYFQDIYFLSFMSTKMFNAKLLKSIDFHIPRYNVLFEDVVMCFEILAKCEKVVTIKDNLYYYDKTNVHSATNTAKQRVQGHINVFALIRHLIDLTGDEEILKLWRKHKIRRKLSLLADAQLDKKHPKKAAESKSFRQQMRLINDKKVLKIEDQPYSKFIKDSLS